MSYVIKLYKDCDLYFCGGRFPSDLPRADRYGQLNIALAKAMELVHLVPDAHVVHVQTEPAPVTEDMGKWLIDVWRAIPVEFRDSLTPCDSVAKLAKAYEASQDENVKIKAEHRQLTHTLHVYQDEANRAWAELPRTDEDYLPDAIKAALAAKVELAEELHSIISEAKLRLPPDLMEHGLILGIIELCRRSAVAKHAPVATPHFDADTCTPNVKVDMLSTDTPPVTFAKSDPVADVVLPPWAQWQGDDGAGWELTDTRDRSRIAWVEKSSYGPLKPPALWCVYLPDRDKSSPMRFGNGFDDAKAKAVDAVDWQKWEVANKPNNPEPVADAEIARVINEMASCIHPRDCSPRKQLVIRWRDTLQAVAADLVAASESLEHVTQERDELGLAVRGLQGKNDELFKERDSLRDRLAKKQAAIAKALE